MDYVRLTTDQDISRPNIFSISWQIWTIALLLIAAGVALAIRAVIMRRKSLEETESRHQQVMIEAGVTVAIIGMLTVGATIVAHSEANYRNIENATTGRNTALIERSYGVEDLQPAAGSYSMLTRILYPSASPSSKYGYYHGNGDDRLEVTAKNSGEHGVRRLILQLDHTNHLRVYEGVGDSQHLLTPASLPEEKG